jgi:hypothetical protein
VQHAGIVEALWKHVCITNMVCAAHQLLLSHADVAEEMAVTEDRPVSSTCHVCWLTASLSDMYSQYQALESL